MTAHLPAKHVRAHSVDRIQGMSESDFKQRHDY